MDILDPTDLSAAQVFNIIDELTNKIDAQLEKFKLSMMNTVKPTSTSQSSTESVPATVNPIPVLISRNVPQSYPSDISSTVTSSNDVGVHKLPVVVVRSSNESGCPLVKPKNSSTRSYQPARNHSSVTYSNRQLDSSIRGNDVTSMYRAPIMSSSATSHRFHPSSYYGPSYEPSFMRLDDNLSFHQRMSRFDGYHSRRESFETLEDSVYEPEYLPYRSRSRFPRVPIPRYPPSYNQYSYDELCSYPSRRYEPYRCYEPLDMRVPPKADRPSSKTFKKLPFYDFISELIKPTKLEVHPGFYQQNEFYFRLDDKEFNTFSHSAHYMGDKWSYKNQVLIRFSLDKNDELEDKLPPGLAITINQESIPLDQFYDEDSRVQKPGPIDISCLIKSRAYKTNKIVINWTEERRRNHNYIVGVYLARKTSSSDLFNRFKVLNPRDADFARKFIIDKLSEDADSEIAMTDLCVSLVCPLGKTRMDTPCRGSGCTHLQCFDGLLFLQMNEHKPVWSCPVCNKPTSFEDLVIDGYFDDILKSSKLEPETNEVRLYRDGSWDNFVLREDPSKRPEKSKPTDDIIDLDSDDSSNEIEVVDLVSEDEDESVYDESNVTLESRVPMRNFDYSNGSYWSDNVCIVNDIPVNNTHYYYL